VDILHARIDRLSAIALTAPPSMRRGDSGTVENATTIKHFNFELMSVGEFFDALAEMERSGRITPDEVMDLIATFPPPTVAHASNEDIRAMPAGISFAHLKEVVAFSKPAGRVEEADRHQRVLDLMLRLEGEGRGVDAQG
jgi:hypothetical protein